MQTAGLPQSRAYLPSATCLRRSARRAREALRHALSDHSRHRRPASQLFSHVPRASNLIPDVFFLLVLPPLLFSSAFLTSWRDFRYNLVSICMLAFGLVAFTVVGVAVASRWILPGFDWRMGLVLGAVVSTTDTIAATAVAKRLGLPKRITDVLEGESLLNDASGLLALEFAVAILVTGQTPSLLRRPRPLALPRLRQHRHRPRSRKIDSPV